MRALPADSFAYFGETAVGKNALPEARGIGGAAGAAADGVGAVVGAGAAAAVVPHCVLRNSFHDCAPRVPAVFAAWYLALHSFAVSAAADEVSPKDNPAARAATERMVAERMSMDYPPGFSIFRVLSIQT